MSMAALGRSVAWRQSLAMIRGGARQHTRGHRQKEDEPAVPPQLSEATAGPGQSPASPQPGAEQRRADHEVVAQLGLGLRREGAAQRRARAPRPSCSRRSPSAGSRRPARRRASGPSRRRRRASPAPWWCRSCPRRAARAEQPAARKAKRLRMSDHSQDDAEEDDRDAAGEEVEDGRDDAAQRQPRDAADAVARGAAVREPRADAHQQPRDHHAAKVVR
jgi:hypothetical protein